MTELSKTHASDHGKNAMFFPDFDSEWDDDLPTVLQVLEGIEVEDMPDIHVEREPTIYTLTRSEIHGPNRPLGLTSILEAEARAAEMQPAGDQSRIVEYIPLRIHSSTVPADSIESSSSSLPSSENRCSATRGEESGAVNEESNLSSQFTAVMRIEGETVGSVGTSSTPTETPASIDASLIAKNKITTKPPKKLPKEIPAESHHHHHQGIAEGGQEVTRTSGSIDKIPDVADSADMV